MAVGKEVVQCQSTCHGYYTARFVFRRLELQIHSSAFQIATFLEFPLAHLILAESDRETGYWVVTFLEQWIV